MTTAPGAVSRFLLHTPDPPPFAFRGAARGLLLDQIEAVGDHDLLVRTEPYKWQLEGLAFALWARRALLFYGMRTGKTKIAFDFVSYLIYSGLLRRKALIIAHAPIGVDEWDLQSGVHSYLSIAAIRSGGDAEDRFMYALNQPGIDVVLASWSTLQQVFSVKREVKTGRKKGQPKLYANRELLRHAAPYFAAAAIDEIHMAGNYDTLRFTIASELVAHCDWRLGMTGTPFGRDPLLMWAEAFLVDGGAALGRSFHFFREAFCKQKYNPFSYSRVEYQFDSEKLPLLRDKMAAMSLTCDLKDVQEVNVLPGVVRLTMSPEQRRAYDEAIDRLVQLRTGNIVEIDNVFTRLRQIASGFLPFENAAGAERIVEFPDAVKFVWLEDFLRSELADDLQIVIFHSFTPTGERICRLLDKLKIPYDWLWGGTKDRPALQARFKSGKSRVLVSNTAAGGMSIDLSVADYLLFFESPPSVIQRRQAEARPLARGSRPLVMDDMVCAKIEQKILDFAAEGEDLRQALLRDPKKLAEELR
jgi:hypothetical protein